jgi:hypothetical protein
MTTDSSKSSHVFAIVESVILGVCVLLITWTAQTVIAQGKALSSHEAVITTNSGRLTSIEDRGSRGLESHSKLDDNRDEAANMRLVKIEAAIVVLQSMAGELKAIAVQLDALRESQTRMEKQIIRTP